MVSSDAYLPLVTLTAEQQTAAESGLLITASDRLQREYRYAYDYARLSAGASAWRAPAISSFDALLRGDHKAAEVHSECPQLLNNVEELALATRCAPEGIAHLAPMFLDAWQTVNAWRLDPTQAPYQSSENTRCFAHWHRAMEDALRAENLITAAELAAYDYESQLQEPPTHLATGSQPLHLSGFDVLTPAQQVWCERQRRAGRAISRDAASQQADALSHGTAARFSSTTAELTAVIGWARAQLQACGATDPLPRIGIIVPDLLQQHTTIRRLLHNLLDASGERTEQLYNLSGGIPLNQQPLIASALRLLQAIHEPTHYQALQMVLADPALPAIQMQERLPAHCQEFLTLQELPQDLCPEPLRVIQRGLSGWTGEALTRRTVGQWWRAAAAVLRTARWHKARTDSEGYQASNALLSLLIEQAPLNGSDANRLVTWAEAFALLQSATGQALFAPAGAPAPVQILGYLEAIDLEFDCLWITGMDETAWPTPVRRNPFLPPAELVAAGVPRYTYPAEFEFAENWLHRVCAAPAALHASFVVEELTEDAQAEPLAGISPLLEHFAFDPALTSEASMYHPLLASWTDLPITLEQFDDQRGPAPEGPRLKAGTRRLQDQAACPMRGWAIHQLGLDESPPPHSLPDALERGQLLHKALELLFAEVDSEQVLQNLGDAQERLLCNNIAQSVVTDSLTGYPRPIRTLEADRISRLLGEILELERKRDAFMVRAREHKAELKVGDYEIELRLDRVDDTPAGQIVIDYKSSAPRVAELLDERLSAPQIPLYVLVLLADGKPLESLTFVDPYVQAGAFAQLRPEATRYVGVCAEAAGPVMPQKLDAGNDWNWLLSRWREQLITLCEEIGAGLAVPDPTARACDRCHLHALCRYHLTRD